MYLNNMHPNKLLSASVLVTNGVQCGSAFPRPGFPAGQNTMLDKGDNIDMHSMYQTT